MTFTETRRVLFDNRTVKSLFFIIMIYSILNTNSQIFSEKLFFWDDVCFDETRIVYKKTICLWMRLWNCMKVDVHVDLETKFCTISVDSVQLWNIYLKVSYDFILSFIFHSCESQRLNIFYTRLFPEMINSLVQLVNYRIYVCHI